MARVLGLINARGGSKGVPRKNIRPLGGRPLIAYAIDAARQARTIDDVVVSTEDGEIAEVARSCGARVPFMRPAELATDGALQIEAIRHAVLTLEAMDERFTHVAVLQPTTPLRTPEDIDLVVGRLLDSGADAAVSVVAVAGVTPYTFYMMDQGGRMRALLEAPAQGVLRQQYPDLYQRSGAVYAFARDTLVEKNSLYGDDCRGVVLPSERSVNIDTPFDWEIAEALIERRRGAPAA